MARGKVCGGAIPMAPDEVWSHETQIPGGVIRMARGKVCGGALRGCEAPKSKSRRGFCRGQREKRGQLPMAFEGKAQRDFIYRRDAEIAEGWPRRSAALQRLEFLSRKYGRADPPDQPIVMRELTIGRPGRSSLPKLKYQTAINPHGSTRSVEH